MAVLELLGCIAEVTCREPAVRDALGVVYPLVPGRCPEAELRYEISRRESDRAFVVQRGDLELEADKGLGDLLQTFDADLSVELQKARSDLYFVHSAVLAGDRGAVLLVGEPGSGKSTTAWGLCHFGFSYMSDELAPLEVAADDLKVLAYCRGLCLKNEPPGGFVLPEAALITPTTFHLPGSAMPSGVRLEPARPSTVFFLSRGDHGSSAEVVRIGRAEAATRLYANTLNALAHPQDGLDCALRIGSQLEAYRLRKGPLADTCELIRATVNGIR